jgi:outer membrane protein OmpA-like peptidoglycan-associated protein
MNGITKVCARFGVVAMIGFGASACSSVPDWADPSSWLGGDSPSGVDAQPGESPDLASIPDRPAPSTTDEEQQQVAQSLAADSAKAKYSADALRGGTEPVTAAPPPPPSAAAAVAPQPAPAVAAPPDQTAAAAPQPGEIDTAANVTPASADNSVDTNAAPTDTASAAPTSPPPATALPPATQPAPQTAVAQAAPPPQSAMPTSAQINPSDAALGFKPSTAPPLDASVAQFVPSPIVARYNQTATQAGMSRVASAAPAPAPKLKRSKRGSAAAMGGPDAMSGAVVANLDAIQQAPETTNQASVYANPQGLPPTSIVFFPGDGTLVNSEGRSRIRAAVDEFKQRGGQGYVRIVGHSSSRTTNMPVEKHLEVIFNKSQDRANAVAKELIKEGVPANHVLVEAVGDSQPVYYESMPKGEDGNRRAEIFLQS